ncbi:MAG: hypothetical protein QXJ59_10840 [Thermofilaceae archaeon]
MSGEVLPVMLPLRLLKAVEEHLRDGRDPSGLLRSEGGSPVNVLPVALTLFREERLYTLDPPLELPSFFFMLTPLMKRDRLPRRVSSIKLLPPLVVELRGDGDIFRFFASDAVGAAALFALWYLLKSRYGIDFLEDLIREQDELLRGMRELIDMLRRINMLYEVLER